MDLLIELLLPLCIYLVFCIFDSLHTLGTLRPPGTSKDPSLGPLQNEVYAFENNIDFARTAKQLGKALKRDIVLCDWHKPETSWNWEFMVDGEFMKEYMDNKKRWWVTKVSGLVLLGILFMIFTSFSKIVFPEPHGTFSFCLTTAATFVLSIVIFKLFARVLYRLSLFCCLHIQYFLDKGKDVIDNLAIKMEDNFANLFRKNEQPNTTVEAYASQVLGQFYDGIEKAEDVEKLDISKHNSAAELMMPDGKLTRYLGDKVITRAADRIKQDIMDAYVDKCREWMIPENGAKKDGLAYDLANFPFSSVTRFLLFDNRGTYTMVALLIVSYMVAGAYSMGGNLTHTTTPMTMEEKMNETMSQEKSAMPIVIDLGWVTMIAMVHFFLYGMLLVMLRQLGLKTLSKLGSLKSVNRSKVKSVGSAVFNELIEFSHTFKLPDEVQFFSSIKRLAGEVAFFSFLIPLLAFIAVTLYILANDDPDVENYKDPIKIIHYVESAKAVAIIIAVSLVVYYTLKNVMQ